MKLPRQSKAFTLIEVLLVVAAIAILAGIVILAINPNKQLGETRNAQRWADVSTILNAIYQYSIDEGEIPTTIPTAEDEICRTDAASCTGLVSLAVLTLNEEYLTAMPVDPTGSSANGTGYNVEQSANGRVTVSAPYAEQSETISVTR